MRVRKADGIAAVQVVGNRIAYVAEHQWHDASVSNSNVKSPRFYGYVFGSGWCITFSSRKVMR